MANFFTNALKNLTQATNKGNLIPLTTHDTSYLSVINNFFGFVLGKHGTKQYTDAYGSNPIVFEIVNKISTVTASIKRSFVDDSGEAIQGRSQLEEILEMPNPDQSLVDFYEEAYENLMLTGNLYIRDMRIVGGLGSAYYVLLSSGIEINANTIGEVVNYTYTNPKTNKTETIPADEILHIKTSNVVNVDNTNIHYGLSPLQAGWLIVQSSEEKFKADASIFKNRGIVGILTNASDNAMLPKERERLQKEYDDEIGGADKYNKIKVSTARLQYIQTGMSPTDLKLLEGILSSLRRLCSIYGLSSILFNDNENSTYNNVSEAKRAAYVDVYLPLAKKVDQKLGAWISERENIQNEHITADLTSIEEIKASTNELAQALSNVSPLVANRILENLTRDEIREIIELAALAQGGDELAGAGTTSVNTNVDG